MQKINVFVACILIVGAFIGGIQLEKYSSRNTIKLETTERVIAEEKAEAYADYYVCTEHLLDLLNKKYNWVDAIDHQGYYETQAEVEHLDYYGIDLAKEQFQKVLEWENQQNK